MDLERRFQRLRLQFRKWCDANPDKRPRRVDCIKAELENGELALELGWIDIAKECYAFARDSAQVLGIQSELFEAPDGQ